MHRTPGTAPPAAGIHLMGDLRNCAAMTDLWHDAEALRRRCVELVGSVGLTSLGSYFHAFDSGGVTGVVVLAESHLALHTWPEERYVTLDVFVCNYSRDNTEKAYHLFAAIAALFEPHAPAPQVVYRGKE